MRSGLRAAGTIVLTAVLAWLGLYSGRGAGRVPAVWWANAALVSLMLLEAAEHSAIPEAAAQKNGERLFVDNARRGWPGLLAAGYAGNLIAHFIIGDPTAEALALSACDIGETAIAAYGASFAMGEGVDLTVQRQLLQFVGFAVLLGPLVASAMAGMALKFLEGSSMMVALRWFPPSALGMSIIPPIVLELARPSAWDLFESGRLSNTLLYLLAIAAGTTAIFWRSEFALLFLILPPLLFLVVRLGMSGGALGCCVVAAIGTIFTVARHRGPLTDLDPQLEQRILLLQMFLAAAVLSVSVVGLVLAQYKRASGEVRESELRYRSLAASMEMLATLDPLTRLANRRRFDEAVETEWQRALRAQSPLSLVLVDTDYFKSYNDYYGHVAGDECLKRVAETMNGLARRPADVVARFGGDEFGMVLPDTDAEGGRLMAENLRRRIEELNLPHAASPLGVVTVSAGCATLVPGAQEAPAALLSATDSALYTAKRRGRNRVATVEMTRQDRMGV